MCMLLNWLKYALLDFVLGPEDDWDYVSTTDPVVIKESKDS